MSSTGKVLKECCICGKNNDGSPSQNNNQWSVIPETGEIPDGDWYLHVHEMQDLANGSIDSSYVYLFCPSCAPDTALPTSDENPDIDMDAFIDKWKDEINS